jgi:nucleotidyltransferase/DNA polymerase involved in DNA repair
VVAPSIEAKRFGIKTGMTVRDARLLYPPVIVRTPDPAKYRAVHLMFRRIFGDYSPEVTLARVQAISFGKLPHHHASAIVHHDRFYEVAEDSRE